ncbi:hypothetical protein E8M24_18930 [Bacillus thuringiensis]|uniref:hypothetical protein n=1 Tax=Bacillus thuringiensis TaxID=1428 RepID=UPI00125EAC89|nr:hypothetical protein [Bacillus thuringiensis]KAB5644668.1 hypothetical protein E8M24_18930 [Bacillus thuringiensis]HDR5269534.1 hypothetical protein [Bacillus thuringiensis]
MSRLIIKMRELKKGECTVVCQHVPNGKIREFKGIYNPKLDMVFMCIAGHYRILGITISKKENCTLRHNLDTFKAFSVR